MTRRDPSSPAPGLLLIAFIALSVVAAVLGSYVLGVASRPDRVVAEIEEIR